MKFGVGYALVPTSEKPIPAPSKNQSPKTKNRAKRPSKNRSLRASHGPSHSSTKSNYPRYVPCIAIKGLNFIRNNCEMHPGLDSLKSLIVPLLKKYGIKKAGIFGSAARGEAAEHSDIDILVELPAGMNLLEFIRIRFALEDALNMKVDLAEYRALKPQLRDGILADEYRLYG